MYVHVYFQFWQDQSSIAKLHPIGIVNEMHTPDMQALIIMRSQLTAAESLKHSPCRHVGNVPLSSANSRMIGSVIHGLKLM